MPRTKFSATDLSQLRHQLDHWRQSQSGATRLPAALWTSAATLALTHGVGPVARTLRLDYNKLKRQVPRSPGPTAPMAPPSFVELRPHPCWDQAVAVGRLELSDPAGIKLTVELPADSASLVGLAQALWRDR